MTHLFNKKTLTRQRQHLRKQMPPAERKLWARIKSRQLKGCRFRRQYSIGSYIVDFFCPQYNLAIEVDGDSHYVSNNKRKADLQRQIYIESCGIKVLRFTNEDIWLRLEGVIGIILHELDEIDKNSAKE